MHSLVNLLINLSMLYNAKGLATLGNLMTPLGRRASRLRSAAIRGQKGISCVQEITRDRTNDWRTKINISCRGSDGRETTAKQRTRNILVFRRPFD